MEKRNKILALGLFAALQAYGQTQPVPVRSDTNGNLLAPTNFLTGNVLVGDALNIERTNDTKILITFVGGITNLADVTNSFSAIMDGDVLTWDSTTGKWLAEAPPGAGAGEANTMSSDTGISIVNPKAGVDLPVKGFNTDQFLTNATTISIASGALVTNITHYGDLLVDTGTTGSPSIGVNGDVLTGFNFDGSENGFILSDGTIVTHWNAQQISLTNVPFSSWQTLIAYAGTTTLSPLEIVPRTGGTNAVFSVFSTNGTARSLQFTTNGFLVFGDVSASVPALRANGAGFEVKLGDNSAFAGFAGSILEAKTRFAAPLGSAGTPSYGFPNAGDGFYSGGAGDVRIAVGTVDGATFTFAQHTFDILSADAFIMDSSSFRSASDSTHDLGTSSIYWEDAYVETVNADAVNVTGTASMSSGRVTNNITFVDTYLSAVAAATNYVADFTLREVTINGTNHINIAHVTNSPSSGFKSEWIATITNLSGSGRTLSFPSGWVWLGTTNNPPTDIPSGYGAVLWLKASGTRVYAGYSPGAIP